MKEIRLTHLKICNFKGIRDLEISFDGKDINVLGDNGTGKTSIIDSFTWLLFNKDSLGRTDFGIKPTDGAGNIIHQLETSVEAVFDISGSEMTLKKTLSEVWTRKRGAAEAEFTRNENSFYIDGVPKKKGEYTAVIKELIDEEIFKILTNPLYFNESVNWKDRRSVLLSICGEVSDEEVIASDAKLAPLRSLLAGKSVSDFKDITASQMKRVNQELEMIPVRLYEAELAKPSEEALEVDYARKDMLEREIDEYRVQRGNILNGVEVTELRSKAKMLQHSLSSVGADFAPHNTPEAKKILDLEKELQAQEFALRDAEHRKEGFISAIEKAKKTRQEYSAEWDRVFAEKFTDNICPTCGRELPEEELEAKRKAFNRKKAAKLDHIETENKELGIYIKGQEINLKSATDQIAEFGSKITALKSDIEQANASLKSLWEAKEKEFEEERAKIRASISETEALIRDYDNTVEEKVREINEQIALFSEELSAINEAVANKALLERQDKRIADLKEQQVRLAAEYTKQEKHLYLAEQFIIAKVNMLNERINQKFKYAKFRLFDKQINGGINEVCEVCYQGIPYKDLNNAARINIGLDVINTISVHYGMTAPIMIDNCESVNELYHTTAQQIRFYVSHDNKLTFKIQED